MNGYGVRDLVLGYIDANRKFPTTGEISSLYNSPRTGRDKISRAVKNNMVKRVGNPFDVRKTFLVPVDFKGLEEAIDNTPGLGIFKDVLETALES